jgi:multidrug efflux pump
MKSNAPRPKPALKEGHTMKLTDLFVRRPVLALVISTMILMLGVIAIKQLPIRQYPMLESSTITVKTTYPGASAELMQGFVTQPIAQAVSSVEGIDYLTSSSVQGAAPSPCAWN